jgi:hypothetical protein
MKRLVHFLASAAALCLAVPSGANAADSGAQQAMNSRQYLVGRWNCAHTVGDFSGTYITSFANALGGGWLRQTYEFPATATEPAWTAEFLTGYDGRLSRWVRMGVLSTGPYFGMVSRDLGDGWMWVYAFPGASGATATWTKKSDSEFTIDGPQYIQNGRPMSERHTCKKSP